MLGRVQEKSAVSVQLCMAMLWMSHVNAASVTQQCCDYHVATLSLGSASKSPSHAVTDIWQCCDHALVVRTVSVMQ